MLYRALSLLIGLFVVSTVACGGGGSDGGGALSGGGTTDPKVFTQQYYTTIFSALAGGKSGGDIAALYTPACRDQVKVADITRGVEAQREETPKIKGAKIDNVDFGSKFKSTKDGNKYTVSVPSSSDSRIHVDGKWQNAHEYLVSIELEDKDSTSSEPQDMALELVDGKLFASDCSDLQSIAKPESTPTPTARAGTPTRVPTTSGATPTRPAGTSTPSSSSGASLSTADANTFAKNYFVTIVGAFAGTKNATDLIGLFAPDCQRQVKAADVSAGLTKVIAGFPKLKGVKIDDVDFGNKLTVKKDGNGFIITVPASKDFKVKYNGLTVSGHEFAVNVGLETASEGGDTDEVSVTVVNGKVYLSDCSNLTGLTQ